MVAPRVNNYSNRQPTSNLNKSSFDENGQFKGTSWNNTSYTKNNANQNVKFEDGKNITIKLNSRYKMGSEAIFKNLDKEHTGISYDLLDIFIEAAKDGILKDIDGKGYTRDNMKNFGKAFYEIQKRMSTSDLYQKRFKSLKDQTSFTFTPNELKKLYEAAGFSLSKKSSDIEQADSNSAANRNLNVIENNSQKTFAEKVEQPLNNRKNTEEQIEESTIKSENELATDTINRNDECKVPEKKGKKYRYKYDKEGNVYRKPTGFFNRIFTKFKKVELTTMQDINQSKPIKKTESLLEIAIKKLEQGEEVITPATSYYDENGDLMVTSYAKLVKLKDNSYAFKDISNIRKEKDIYYTIEEKLIIGAEKPMLVTGKEIPNAQE